MLAALQSLRPPRISWDPALREMLTRTPQMVCPHRRWPGMRLISEALVGGLLYSRIGMVMAPAAQSGTPARASRRFSGGIRQWWVLPLGVVLIALVMAPRLIATDVFVTTDELFWLGRSGTFARALNQGRFDQTFLTGHPGVPTMWSAVASLGIERAQQFAGPRREVSRREVSQQADFMPALARARQGVGVVTGLAVLALAALAWRLYGPLSAVLTAGILAFEPFLLAHSRLLHIDAELASFIGLAVLAAIAGWSGRLGAWIMAVSGLATALALLAKAPATMLLGFIPLMGLLMHGPSALRSGRVWMLGIIWALATVVAYFTVWPAMWTAPGATLGGVLSFMRDNTNPPEVLGPGAEERAGRWFYLHTLLFRTSPLTLIGVVLALLACALSPDRDRLRWRSVTGSALACAIGFGLLMTFAAKNFDRYLLPVVPLLATVAGFGWAAAIRAIAPRSAWRTALATVALIGIQVALAMSTAPYFLTFFNPLAGGPERGARAIASGWGEGLDQVAVYLNAQPNPQRLKVGLPGEIYTTVLGAQTRAQVAPADQADATSHDYLVVYVRNRQLGESSPSMDERFLPWQPEQVVRIHGIDYAWIYDTRQGAPIRLAFPSGAVLNGYTVQAVRLRPGQTLQATLFWSGAPAGYTMEARLRASDGTALAQASVDLDGTSREPTRVVLNVPADAATREYMLETRLLDHNRSPQPVSVSDSEGWVTLRGIELRAERR